MKFSEEIQFEEQNRQNHTLSKNKTLSLNESIPQQTPMEPASQPPMYRNVTTSMTKSVQARPTDLRRNPYYYQIYYVYLNTIFASILPLFLLLFFNINTARELFKMSKLESRSLVSRASNVNLNRRATMVDFNPRGEPQDPRVEALRMAADAHGLEGIPNGTSDPLLAHQSCGYDTTALPVITLTEESKTVDHENRVSIL